VVGLELVAESETASSLRTFAGLAGGPIGAALAILFVGKGNAVAFATFIGWAISQGVVWYWERDVLGKRDSFAGWACIGCVIIAVGIAVVSL
jgi:hypothetical protein